ncbi:low density lipoprotein receptor adapter protein 1-A-like [Contarinia nasturtii]|uniref:low density lipoprotein receptor adapter protein 1-A-like n=1 Tax=Contarinia nasturtii TaxID=265458 RepID=UPI0012D3B79D|nr:low density lipoprotein receptor adapter protein 1-A-like [Contarinia nasturtii]
MSKVALYFRRWKNYTRQKNAGEDWAFATKLTDLSENYEDDCENAYSDLEIFQAKFLGSTTIQAAKSEKATANAIKSIISSAKASGKKLQRIKLSVCARGIETFDAMTGVTLHKVSIYQISYCSADAAHSNVFAFIAGQRDSHEMCNNDTDELTCYAFLCAKRKIAYNLTVTVAKNFERAYDMWKKSEVRSKTEQYDMDRSMGQTNTLQIKSNLSSNERNCSNRKSLLIDFNSDTLTSVERQRQLLQNAWVSFDDEPLLNNDNDDMQPVSGKIFENNLWDGNAICS